MNRSMTLGMVVTSSLGVGGVLYAQNPGPGLPDLFANSGQALPRSVIVASVGKPTVIRIPVQNIGKSAAKGFVVTATLTSSPDGSSSKLLFTSPPQTVAASTTTLGPSFSFTPPKRGDFILTVAHDATNQVSEANETNNTEQFKITAR